MGENHFAENINFVNISKFYAVVGYNAAAFLALWDTTEKVFLFCGIQRKKFFPLWDTMDNNLRMAHNFFPLYPTTQEFFFRSGI
jgi:hypothetical protein